MLHARLAAVPMVGFGFMDNIIMIQAGDMIDATFGVTFGLTTLTAAALGNICSDSSGVLFGGIVESLSDKLRLTKPNLTAAQLDMRATRLASTFGALGGIICGCVLGMTNLLFMDLEKTERLKRMQMLETVFEPVICHLDDVLQAERCTLYLYDEDSRELWTKIAVAAPSMRVNRHGQLRAAANAGGGGGGGSQGGSAGAAGGVEGRGDDIARIIRIPLDSESLATNAARTGQLINVADAKSDPRHDGTWDAKTGFVTRQVLCYPIYEDGKLYGCLQAVNKRLNANHSSFTSDDEKMMRMLSLHISVFAKAVSG